MPKAPALIGKLAQSLIGRQARVLSVDHIAPDFLEVHFWAEPPPGGWQPGHEVQVRATPTQGRRYTVRRVDDADRITLLAALHGDGPGTRWFRALRPGVGTVLLAGRHLPLRLCGTRRLFLGDGSALGTFDAYHNNELSPVAPVVALEVPAESAEHLRNRWPDYLFIPAHADRPGAAAQSWLKETLHENTTANFDAALLLGHAQSIQNQRRILITSKALDRHAITTRPYWATGRTGL